MFMNCFISIVTWELINICYIINGDMYHVSVYMYTKLGFI